MRCSTPRRWTKPSKIVLAAGLLLALPHLALPSFAQDLPDLHLDALPRTSLEQAGIASAVAAPADPAQPQRFELRSGGSGTVRVRRGDDAFSQPAANLTTEQDMTFRLGQSLFQRLWVSAPSSTIASDGLGPLYNARGCDNCHQRDGRGRPPIEGADHSSLFLRISVPAPEGTQAPGGIAEWLATLPHPAYGSQMQDFALQGQQAEYRLAVDWEEIPVALNGGETVRLRRPTWRAEDLAFGPLGDEAMLSPRVAPQMIGLGLLEAIPAAEILALADPDDADADGISGRANIVWSQEFHAPMLGRFGHKAGAPSVREQSAMAFSADVGLSTSILPAGWGDCTEAQTACREAPDGGDPEHGGLEIGDEILDLVTFYAANLGVPARRDVGDPEVLRGRAIFHESGCAACHRPAHVTARMRDGDDPRSFQLIWPYTDLLLHDMGEGLADHRPEGRATGTEWRTAPLWGLGLTERVSGYQFYLHDGRARSLLEAILWHGGEAEPARDAVVDLAPDDRSALLRFLGSL